MRILILALPGIGDALMFTPASKRLKDCYPDSRIDVLAMFKGVDDLYSSLPEINEVFYFDFINSSPIASLKNILSFRKKYDLTISIYPSNRLEYNVMQLLIGAGKRAGTNYLHQNLRNLNFLTNVQVNEDNSSHNVETNIQLIDKITGQKTEKISSLRFPLNENDLEAGYQTSSNLNISDSDFVIGFHPGGSIPKNHINKRWSPGNFTELAKRLIAQDSSKVLVFGGPDEQNLKDEIVNNVANQNCKSVNTKSLNHTAAVMKRCDVFVTNDTSLMHVAAALKLKTIALEGPLNINFTRPWQTDHKIVSLNLECSPCFYYSPKHLTCYREDVKFKCMKEITVEMVEKAVEEYCKSI